MSEHKSSARGNDQQRLGRTYLSTDPASRPHVAYRTSVLFFPQARPTLSIMIHHVQVACPRGSEEALRGFYVGVLGMTEKPKPHLLAVRGGCWFTDAEGAELHLGVEDDFRPARKAHPALTCTDLDALAARLTAAGYPVTWADPAEQPDVRRFHSEDCHGNRLEFVTAL